MGDFTALLMRILDIGADLISKFLSVAQNIIIIGILTLFTWKYGLSNFNITILYALYAYLAFQIVRTIFDLVGYALLDGIEARILHEDPMLRRISERILFPPFSRHTFNNYADSRIQAIYVCREPIQNYLRYMMAGFNALCKFTLGNLIGGNYEPVYHVSFLIIVKRGKETRLLKLQKTEVVELKTNFEFRGTSEMEPLKVPRNLTVRGLFENMRRKLPIGYFTDYRLFNNNCQTFAIDLLRSNSLLTEQLKKFIQQDIKEIFKELTPITEPATQIIVQLARIVSYLFQIK